MNEGIRVTKCSMSRNIAKILRQGTKRPRLLCVMVLQGGVFLTPVNRLKYVPKWFPGNVQAVQQLYEQGVNTLCLVFDNPKRVWFWTGCWGDYEQLIDIADNDNNDPYREVLDSPDLIG